jgi:DNA replicative helicase MCM subunit Mcm2 (Cdc46/Mcm family)
MGGRYVEMRSLGGSKKVITATPRQLESMIRISEALAKMRLSQTVEKYDVKVRRYVITRAYVVLVASARPSRSTTSRCGDM